MSKIDKPLFWNTYKKEYISLLKLGFPVLITQLGIIIVGFADTMMVGMYGTQELAAASFVNNFFNLFLDKNSTAVCGGTKY